MNSKLIKSTTLDKLAIFMSSVCIVHCLLTPIAVTLLPILTLNIVVEDVLFHKMMLWFVLPTSAIALFIGCRKHRDFLIVSSGIIGLLILILVTFWGHDLLNPILEKVVTSLGGLVLATSHFLNYRSCQSITCEDKSCATEHHH